MTIRPTSLTTAALALWVSLLTSAAQAAEPPPGFAGAIALTAQYGPDYLGAARSGVSVRPGFFVRWGRISASSGGGWAARRQDASASGLGIELSHREDLDLSLGLRADSGRSESDSPALAGMGAVKRTIRARAAADWRFAHGWQLGAAWTVDAFNRGGGDLGELRLKHDWKLSPAMTLNTGIALTVAGDRYMQTYFGVTPEQSARSGNPVYTPSLGLRDVNLYATVKYELTDDWVLTGGPGLTRVLGPAARSPLTKRQQTWNLGAGVAYRF